MRRIGLTLIGLLVALAAPAAASQFEIIAKDITWTSPTFANPLVFSGSIIWDTERHALTGAHWTMSGLPPLLAGLVSYSHVPMIQPGPFLSLEANFGWRDGERGVSGFSHILLDLPGESTLTTLKPGVARDSTLFFETTSADPTTRSFHVAGLGPTSGKTLVRPYHDEGPGNVVFAGGGAHKATYSTPEHAILPRLPRLLKTRLGEGFARALTTQMQVATASLAAGILQSPRDGLRIERPTLYVDVIEACAGLSTLVKMLAAATLIACVLPATRRPWAFVLVAAAVLLAVEANALRVAGVAIGLEQTAGTLSWAQKGWIQAGTTLVALAQLVGLGRLVAR